MVKNQPERRESEHITNIPFIICKTNDLYLVMNL